MNASSASPEAPATRPVLWSLKTKTFSDRRRVVGCLLLDIREGELIVARAAAVIVATGGSAGVYKTAAVLWLASL
jgi:succinate dehydrogenase/fumarate reductase flavoprotein subunit